MNALQRDLKKLVPLVESLGKETIAADPHRQRFHLQPPVGWLNDPNGLCVYGGQYHAFFQYGPFDVNGGVKHWGHAVSTDLLHWEQLPVMLYPDEPFDCHGAYSGSALVEDGTMYLYYTGNVKHPGNFDYIKEGRGHNVCLAVSKDGVTLDSKQCLLTNRDYPAGLTCHVRDPKVFAYEGRYYMVLGARTLEDKGEVLVLESTDKLRWTHINTLTTPEPFGYMWECPDLFCLDGQWYLAVSPQGIQCQNVYGCGWFAIYGDWRGDCTLSEFHELDAGFDYYAPPELCGRQRLPHPDRLDGHAGRRLRQRAHRGLRLAALLHRAPRADGRAGRHPAAEPGAGAGRAAQRCRPACRQRRGSVPCPALRPDRRTRRRLLPDGCAGGAAGVY